MYGLSGLLGQVCFKRQLQTTLTMKTYEINLDDFEIDVITSIDFNTSTIEDATLAGIVEQIKQQTEPQEN